ncbi:hypothetical protein JVU11DRAFT_10932 [Chiua virens]|nr:hypothetical protein JVU11DRAFT_10932 [Chiua virens]
MPPSLLPQLVGQQNIRVPTAPWEAPGNQVLQMPHIVIPLNAIGYNANHLAYPAKRNQRAHVTYVSPVVETIMLSILALFDSGKHGRLHGTPIGNICEGMRDIDACMTAPKLRELALNIIIPCILHFCPNFPWRTGKFIVHDDSWVDLAKYAAQTVPYFYDKCLHDNSKKNAKGQIFKHKAFSLNVVVPHSQWMEYQAFQNCTASSMPGLSHHWCSSSPQPFISESALAGTQRHSWSPDYSTIPHLLP